MLSEVLEGRDQAYWSKMNPSETSLAAISQFEFPNYGAIMRQGSPSAT
jgi:hypothetical protein